MTDATQSALEHARADFYSELPDHGLAPLWTVLHSLVTPEPRTAMRPALWRYENVRKHLMRAGELISAEEAERRVLILENPAAPGQSRITQTLYAGLQLILPGEIAPCHRHSQSALRFVLEGEGAYTAVDGEKAMMAPFDLILTPAGAWHDHGHRGRSPMIWLDGLDIPMVSAFDASFSEKLADGRSQHPETGAPGDTQARRGAHLRLVEDAPPATMNPLFHYPYASWKRALLEMARRTIPHPSRGVMMEFLDPACGGSVMPTISAFCQYLPSGFRTLPARTTDAAILVVVEGEGLARIGEMEFALEPRAIFVAPAWTPRALEASSDLIVFSFSDRAAQERLGLWRGEG